MKSDVGLICSPKRDLGNNFGVKTWITDWRSHELVSYEVSSRDAHQYLNNSSFVCVRMTALHRIFCKLTEIRDPLFTPWLAMVLWKQIFVRHLILCQNSTCFVMPKSRFCKCRMWWKQICLSTDLSGTGDYGWLLTIRWGTTVFEFWITICMHLHIIWESLISSMGFSHLRRRFDIAKRWFLCHLHFKPLSVPSKRQGYWFPLAVGVRSHRLFGGWRTQIFRNTSIPTRNFNGLVRLD